MQMLILTLVLVFIAEIGDKTQILVMAYGKKLNVRRILSDVFFGAMISYSISILLGRFFHMLLPFESIRLLSGILFVLFGLLSLTVIERPLRMRISPEKTSLTWAFIRLEIGDKTQLVTLMLAMQAQEPILVWIGAVLGIVAVTGLGIITGQKIGGRFPEYRLRALAWLLFSALGVYQILTSSYAREMGMTFMLILMGSIMTLNIFRWVIFRRQIKEISMSMLKQEAEALMQVKKKIASDFCKNCTKCKGSDCAVNCMMRLLEGEKLPTSIDLEAFQNLSFDSSKARALLKTLSDYHDAHPEEARLNNAFEGVEKILNQAISRDEILKTIEFKES